ncbi:MAG TPA: hypothetical protein VJP85_07915 [Candidatus Baltobacteraceae bacterium]|nr:hypothetical protein [Candidatus Baltobacteraceae bacterium]
MRTTLAWLACMAGLAIAAAACSGSAAPTVAPMNMQHPMSGATTPSPTASTGFTPGWFKGKTVTFFYHTNNFFCHVPVADGQPVGSTSGCETGSEGIVDPRPGGSKIPFLYVMTPLGFRPDTSTLHCPTVGMCINHPSTIDLSRIGGPSNAPLPAHSHIIDADTGNWWELIVIGVKDLGTWNQIVAGKSLATVRALQAADPAQTHITDDKRTNTYLFFEVQP